MTKVLRLLLNLSVVALFVRNTHSVEYVIDTTHRVEHTTEIASSWTGKLKLYKDTNVHSLLISLAFNTANLCFNLDCGDIDDAVSSASWKGLPLRASFRGASTSLLMFYSGIDCTGVSQGWPTSHENAPDITAVGMNDMASSFMFLQNYTGAHNGIQNICDY